MQPREDYTGTNPLELVKPFTQTEDVVLHYAGLDVHNSQIILAVERGGVYLSYLCSVEGDPDDLHSILYKRRGYVHRTYRNFATWLNDMLDAADTLPESRT